MRAVKTVRKYADQWLWVSELEGRVEGLALWAWFKFFFQDNSAGFYLVHATEVCRMSLKFLAQVLLGWKHINSDYDDRNRHRLGRENTVNFGHVECYVYHGHLFNRWLYIQVWRPGSKMYIFKSFHLGEFLNHESKWIWPGA